MGETLFEKVWNRHVVVQTDEATLLYIDRHLVHEVTSPQAFDGLRLAGRGVRRSDLTFATIDHNIPTDNQLVISDPLSRRQVEAMRANCREFGIPLYDIQSGRQGIVHVIGPELGLTLPGFTIVCGDSHTSTHGAFGAIAFGIGTSEVEHVLATQTLWQGLRPASFGIEVTGRLAPGLEAKDIVLAIIRKIGTGGATGHAIEYYGSAIKALSMEGRMTICNMSIEAGARAGLIAPDDVTIEYIAAGNRPFAPRGAAFEAAVADWRTLITDDDDAISTGELHARRRLAGAAGDLGDEPSDDGRRHRRRARPGKRSIRRTRRRSPRARVYGASSRNARHGYSGRRCLHRILHERTDRRSADGGKRLPRSPRSRPGCAGAQVVPGSEAVPRSGGRRSGLRPGFS